MKHKEMQAQQQQQVAAASQTQAPPPPVQEMVAPDVPRGTVPITERIVTAWIGQFDKLSEPEQQKLKELGGLGGTEEPPTDLSLNINPIAQEPEQNPNDAVVAAP